MGGGLVRKGRGIVDEGVVRQEVVHHVPCPSAGICSMVIVVAIIVVIVIVIVVVIVIVFAGALVFVIVVGVVIVIVVIDIIDVTVPLRIAVVVVVPAVMVVAAMAILGSIDRVLIPIVGVDGRRLGGHGVGVLDGRRSSAASAGAAASASAAAAAAAAATSALGRAVRAADHPHAFAAAGTCTGCRRIEALERIQAVVVARRGTAAVIAATCRSTSGARPLSPPAGPRFRPAPRHDRAGPADLGTASAAVAVAPGVAAARARHCICCIQFALSLLFGSVQN